MEIKKGMAYSAKHVPTGETWHILGINKSKDLVCAAGWPPTQAKLSDCVDLKENGELDEDEVLYRRNKFGDNWDN